MDHTTELLTWSTFWLSAINIMHGSCLFRQCIIIIYIKCPWNCSRFQCSMPLIELRQRCSRRSVVGMRSSRETPQIHLTIPLSAVTNCWASLVTTGQVLLPYKSTCLTLLWKTFPLHFVWIAGLLKMVTNSWNAFHEETIHVETVSEQPLHWPIISPRYLKVDST